MVVTIPLDGATARDGILPLTLVTRLRVQDDVCTSIHVGSWLELRNATLTLTGTMSPGVTVATFFPPALTRLTLLVPPDATAGEAETALRLAATATRQYAGYNPEIVVAALDARDGLPNATDDTLFERTVVIQEGGQDGMSVVEAGDGMPLLRLGGSADSLRNSSLLFAGDDAALAASASVQVAAIPSLNMFNGGQTTLADLGFGNLQVTGVGRMDLPITLAQADLGGAVQSMMLHVRGAYTPVVEGASGTLSILVNSTLVRAVALGREGMFDFSVPVEGENLRRDNTLIARFDYTPTQGECRMGMNTFTGQIDGNSTLTVARGQGLNAGFARFPQAFAGGLPVAFETLDAGSVNRAAQIVAALQATTRAALNPQVLGWGEATGGTLPALLVASGAERVTPLNPPLLPDPVRVLDAAGDEVLRVEADAAFAALEAFEQNGRDLLLATGDAASLDTLVTTLRADPLGWYGLNGDTYLYRENLRPVSLQLRDTPAIQIVPASPQPAPLWTQLQPFVFFILVVVVLIVLVLVYPRVVRRAPK